MKTKAQRNGTRPFPPPLSCSKMEKNQYAESIKFSHGGIMYWKIKWRPLFMLGLLLIVAAGRLMAADTEKAKAGAAAKSSGLEHYMRGLGHKLLKEESAAREEFKAAIEAEPEFVPAHREYIQSLRPAKARTEYEERLKKQPDSAALHLAMGDIHLSARKFDLAEAEFKRAATLDPPSPWVHLYFGLLARQKGAGEQALAEYRKAAELGKNNALLHATLASSYARMKQFQAALSESDQALKLNPHYLSVYTTRWRARMSLDKATEPAKTAVRKEIENIRRTYAQRADALVIAKEGYEILEDKQRAESLVPVIKKMKPEWDGQGMVRIQGSPDAAGKIVEVTIRGSLYKQIIESSKDSEKNPAEAIKSLQKIEAQMAEPDARKLVLYPRLARAYIQAGRFEDAERLIAPLDRKDKTDIEEMLAMAYADKKAHLQKALAIAKAAVEKNREFKPQPRPEDMAEDLWLKFNSEEQQQKRHKGTQARAYDLLGWVQQQMGTLDEAEENLSMSLELARNESNLFHMALLRQEQGQSKGALELFIEAYRSGGKKKEEAKQYAEKLQTQLHGSKEALEAELAKAATKEPSEAAGQAVEAQDKDDDLNKPAAEFALANLQGATVKLSDLRGKVVFLNFWATW